MAYKSIEESRGKHKLFVCLKHIKSYNFFHIRFSMEMGWSFYGALIGDFLVFSQSPPPMDASLHHIECLTASSECPSTLVCCARVMESSDSHPDRISARLATQYKQCQRRTFQAAVKVMDEIIEIAQKVIKRLFNSPCPHTATVAHRPSWRFALTLWTVATRVQGAKSSRAWCQEESDRWVAAWRVRVLYNWHLISNKLGL